MSATTTPATLTPVPASAHITALLPAALAAAVSDVASRVRVSVAEVHSRGGSGSGTIWSADGVVVTNHHVLPSDSAEVILEDGRAFDGHVVARDPRNDLAVLQVHGRGLPAATLGDARALRPGQLVIAVGNPAGVRGAVTAGVVHRALPRSHPGRGRELIQADVLLGPGSSGGPLADAHGRVVGINAMVQGGPGRMALAVPSHVVARLVNRHGARPELGIAAHEVLLSPTLAAQVAPIAATPVGYPADAAPDTALLISNVAPNSAAERAGLMLGDLLYALDGHPVEGGAGLLNALDDHFAGDLRVSILRGGVPREIDVQLGAADSAAASPERQLIAA